MPKIETSARKLLDSFPKGREVRESAALTRRLIAREESLLRGERASERDKSPTREISFAAPDAGNNAIRPNAKSSLLLLPLLLLRRRRVRWFFNIVRLVKREQRKRRRRRDAFARSALRQPSLSLSFSLAESPIHYFLRRSPFRSPGFQSHSV